MLVDGRKRDGCRRRCAIKRSRRAKLSAERTVALVPKAEVPVAGFASAESRLHL